MIPVPMHGEIDDLGDGEEPDHYRKLMEPPLHPSQLPNYTEMMIAQTHRIASQWKDGETVDMLVESRKIPLLIIMDALFSKDAWDDLPRIWNPILKSIQYISPGAWIVWRQIPRFGFRKPLRELASYLYSIIEERRKHVLGNVEGTNDGMGYELQDTQHAVRNTDLLQHLIDAGLSDDVIRHQIFTMHAFMDEAHRATVEGVDRMGILSEHLLTARSQWNRMTVTTRTPLPKGDPD